MVAVEPCPFCEGVSIFCLSIDLVFDNRGKHLVCASCGAAGPICKSKDEAAEKWNYRPHQNRELKMDFDFSKPETRELYEAEVRRRMQPPFFMSRLQAEMIVAVMMTDPPKNEEERK